MFRKLGRAMTSHDVRHDFILYKTPGPIACRALVVGEKLFNGVVIQRSHAMPGFSTVLYLLRFCSAIALSHGPTPRVSRQSDSRRQRIQDPARPGGLDC